MMLFPISYFVFVNHTYDLMICKFNSNHRKIAIEGELSSIINIHTQTY